MVIVIQLSFVGMLFVSCAYEYNVCSMTRIPMISDVIADSVFDRLFILLNTAYFFGVHQVNVRALHARFHGIISPKTNTVLLFAGLASSFSLPLIGMFDNRSFLISHFFFAGVFFTSAAFYLSYTALLMHRHKAALSGRHWRKSEDALRIERKIDFNFWYSHLCTSTVSGTAVCLIVYGDKHSLTALFEWVCVFAYMTLTMLIMSTIPCSD